MSEKVLLGFEKLEIQRIALNYIIWLIKKQLHTPHIAECIGLPPTHRIKEWQNNTPKPYQGGSHLWPRSSFV